MVVAASRQSVQAVHGPEDRPAERSLDPAELMVHPLRQRIREHVEGKPGIPVQSLASDLACSRTTVRFHLHQMERAGLLITFRSGRRTHLFVAGVDDARQRHLAMLKRGRVLAFGAAVASHPGLSQCQIGERLRMGRKTLRKYADLLLAEHLVEEKAEGHVLRYFPRPRLRALLATA